MDDSAKPDYRERYEGLLDEFGQLERTSDEQDQLLRTVLGRVFFAIDKAYPDLAEESRQVRDLLRQTGDQPLPLTDLRPLIERLAEQIRQLEAAVITPERQEQKSTIPPATRARNESMRDFLALLLERIAFTEAMESRRTRLITSLEDPHDQTLTSILIDRAACLINDMRRMIEREKADLANFLKQVTEALSDIDQHTQSGLNQIQAQRDAHAALNAAVEEHVGDMHRTVDNASDLDQLKTAVRERLQRIRQQIKQFRESEEQRLHQSEAEAQRMRARVETLEKQTAELDEQLRASQNQLLRDTLTGLPNRLALDERMTLEVARTKRDQTPLCLAVWDVDRFKSINDTFGHQAGDKALHVVGKTLFRLVRDVDMVARFGGEEFVMLLPDTSPEQAMEVVERIRDRLANTAFRFKEEPLRITLSCGLTQYRPGEQAEDTFARADQALYQAKEGGRNRCVQL